MCSFIEYRFSRNLETKYLFEEGLGHPHQNFNSYDSVILIPDEKGMAKLSKGSSRTKKKTGGYIKSKLQYREAKRNGGDTVIEEIVVKA